MTVDGGDVEPISLLRERDTSEASHIPKMIRREGGVLPLRGTFWDVDDAVSSIMHPLGFFQSLLGCDHLLLNVYTDLDTPAIEME
jgi:hypothetical protein